MGKGLVSRGAFGEATSRAPRGAVRALERAFGRTRLLGVPGFFAGEEECRSSFILVGDYAL